MSKDQIAFLDRIMSIMEEGRKLPPKQFLEVMAVVRDAIDQTAKKWAFKP